MRNDYMATYVVSQKSNEILYNFAIVEGSQLFAMET